MILTDLNMVYGIKGKTSCFLNCCYLFHSHDAGDQPESDGVTTTHNMVYGIHGKAIIMYTVSFFYRVLCD